MKKMTLTLFNLTEPCNTVFCTSFLFYINMFNTSNLSKIQHSIDVDLFHLGWVKSTLGNTLKHKVKQINIKVISKYKEA